MRFLRVVLALAFGLSMAGQDTRACSHHHDLTGHHKGTQDSAPHACCPPSVNGALPAISAGSVAVPLPVVVVAVAAAPSLLLPARKHILPLALGPPHSLA